MDETRQATHAKDEFFSAGMYVFHVTGFPPPLDVLTRKAEAPPGARLDVWRTDPASDRHIPGPGAEGVAFSTADFSLVNSGNRTLRTPKRSWKITLDGASGDAGRLAGMTCVNLKSMYNDPSQMREALAWRLFGRAGVPAPRHTYAKLAFDATYDFCKNLGIEMRLSALGVPKDDLGVMADEAHAIRRLLDNNPRDLGRDAILNLYEVAF